LITLLGCATNLFLTPFLSDPFPDPFQVLNLLGLLILLGTTNLTNRANLAGVVSSFLNREIGERC